MTWLRGRGKKGEGKGDRMGINYNYYYFYSIIFIFLAVYSYIQKTHRVIYPIASVWYSSPKKNKKTRAAPSSSPAKTRVNCHTLFGLVISCQSGNYVGVSREKDFCLSAYQGLALDIGHTSSLIPTQLNYLPYGLYRQPPVLMI